MSEQSNSKPQDDSKSLDMYQRLADVSLRTSATTLTILFAYTFAVGLNASLEFKYLIIGVGLTLLFSIVFGVFCLIGRRTGELTYIRICATVSTVLMLIAMGFAFTLLVVALFGH
jgi:hypothetical protein